MFVSCSELVKRLQGAYTDSYQTLIFNKSFKFGFARKPCPTLNIPIYCLFQHRDTQQTLTVLERLDLDTEKPTAEETAKKFGFEDDFYSGSISWWQKTKPKIWSTFDEPYSSSLAKVSWK